MNEKEFYKGTIEKYKDEFIKDLSDLVGVPSVNGNDKTVKEALEVALEIGRKAGLTATSFLDGRIGVIEMGEGEETLGILTHVDVVEVGNETKWQSPPFEISIRNGNVYGRGVIDDKGPLVCTVYAMKAVKEFAEAIGSPLRKKVQLIIGTQEEGDDWSDIGDYVTKFPVPDYSFTPDGSYPLCNVEKGFFDIVLSFPMKDEKSGESDGTFVESIKSGVAENIVPGDAEAVLIENGTRIKLTAAGKAVHSSKPEKGQNAFVLLITELLEQGITDEYQGRLFKMFEEMFSSVHGENLGIYTEDEYLNGEFIHRNVVSPTKIWTEDNRLYVLVDIRFVYGNSEDELYKTFEKLVAEFGGKIESCNSMPAVYVPKDSPYLTKLADAYEAVTGIKNEFSLEYGATYAKAMKNTVTWGPILPKDMDTTHEENEFLSLDSLLTNSEIFANAIGSIVLTEEKLKGEN